MNSTNDLLGPVVGGPKSSPESIFEDANSTISGQKQIAKGTFSAANNTLQKIRLLKAEGISAVGGYLRHTEAMFDA